MATDSNTEAIAEAIANAIAQAVTQAMASANAANAQAASTTGTTTGRTVSDEGVKTGFVRAQVDSDVGIEEAWAANVKSTYDIHQTWFNDVFGALQKQRAQLDHLTNQLFQNGINSGHLQHLGAITDQNLGTDRKMNINETDLAAKSAAVITDGIIAALGKAAQK
jgi:hypothetical protein